VNFKESDLINLIHQYGNVDVPIFFLLLFLLPFVVNKDVHYRVKFLKIWVWPTLGGLCLWPHPRSDPHKLNPLMGTSSYSATSNNLSQYSDLCRIENNKKEKNL